MPLISAVGRAPIRSSVGPVLLAVQRARLRDLQELGVVVRHLREQRALVVGEFEDVVVEAGHLHAAVRVVQRRDEAGDRRRRVRNRAAEHAGVQVEIGAVEVHRARDQPAHAGDHARDVRRDHAGVGDDDDVGVETIAVRGEQFLEVRRAGLLLALDQELERDRRAGAAGRREVRAQAEQVEQQLALVVGRAARTQHVTVDRRVERVGVPQLQRVDRLHVVVAVDEDDRRVRVVAAATPRTPRAATRRPSTPRPSGSRRRAPRRRTIRHCARRRRDGPGIRADAGNPQPGIEIREQVLAVVGDVVTYGRHARDDSLTRIMAKSVDVLVVGAGLMGAASAWSLTRRGRVGALVRAVRPAARARQLARQRAHHAARVRRRALHPARGPGVRAVARGRAGVRRRRCCACTAALDFGAERGVARHRAPPGRRRRRRTKCCRAAEAEARWPGMRFDGEVVFHAQAGTLDAALAVDAMVGAGRRSRRGRAVLARGRPRSRRPAHGAVVTSPTGRA